MADKFYAGFDCKVYPLKEVMDWLRDHTNIVWCGYYLAPAPNRSPVGWNGQYSSLKDKWGVLPVYVGQQDAGTATPGYTPSSILTIDQGRKDGKDAAQLAANDSFPRGTYVYLDWELGSIDSDGSDYVKAWVETVAADGRVGPGIYCSYVVAQKIADLIDTINPTPHTRFWCWNLSQPDPDLMRVWELDPKGCGFDGAQAWQMVQNAPMSFPADAPISSLQMDFGTSSLADPGAPGVDGTAQMV